MGGGRRDPPTRCHGGPARLGSPSIGDIQTRPLHWSAALPPLPRAPSNGTVGVLAPPQSCAALAAGALPLVARGGAPAFSTPLQCAPAALPPLPRAPAAVVLLATKLPDVLVSFTIALHGTAFLDSCTNRRHNYFGTFASVTLTAQSSTGTRLLPSTTAK